MGPRLHLITNGVFTASIAGGDIHFLKLAEGAAHAGYQVNLFGGHALREVVAQQQLPATVTLTDDARMARVDQGALSGQVAMFRDFYGRFRRTLQLLPGIAPEDYAYAVSDYWFDVLPVVRSRARRRLMVLHMEAPSFGQIVTRGRTWIPNGWPRFITGPARSIPCGASALRPALKDNPSGGTCSTSTRSWNRACNAWGSLQPNEPCSLTAWKWVRPTLSPPRNASMMRSGSGASIDRRASRIFWPLSSSWPLDSPVSAS
jgi:hypothetical protein